MKLKSLLTEIHRRIEQNEGARITQSAMASRLGVSYRTYLEYLRGTNAPLAMHALLEMLSQLSDSDLSETMGLWRRGQTSMDMVGRPLVTSNISYAGVGRDLAGLFNACFKAVDKTLNSDFGEIVAASAYVVAIAQAHCSLGHGPLREKSFAEAESQLGSFIPNHLQDLSCVFERQDAWFRREIESRVWPELRKEESLERLNSPFMLPDLYLDMKSLRSREKSKRKGNTEKLMGAELLYSTQYFTEPYMAFYLAETCFDLASQQTKDGSLPVFFDPACGAANLLIAAFKISYNRLQNQGLSQHDAGALAWSYLAGYDIDPVVSAIGRAALSVSYVLQVGEEPPSSPAIWTGENDGAAGFLDKDVMARLVSKLPAGVRVVITNPPFLGRRLMDPQLKSYLGQEFSLARGDLSAAFTLACSHFLSNDGDILGLVHQNTFWHLSSLTAARLEVQSKTPLVVRCNLGAGAFRHLSGEKAAVSLSVFQRTNQPPVSARQYDLSRIEVEKKKASLAEILSKGIAAGVETNPSDMQDAISMVEPPAKVSSYGHWSVPMQGTSTGNSADAVCFSWEVPADEHDWVGVSKGGGYAKWWGLNRYSVLWGEAGEKLKRYPGHALRNVRHMQSTELVFSDTGTQGLSVRRMPEGQIFIASGPGIRLQKGNSMAHLAFLNSRYASYVLRQINPKLTIAAGYIKKLPFENTLASHQENGELASKCVHIKQGYLAEKLTNDECSIERIFKRPIQDFGAYFRKSIKFELASEMDKLRYEAKIEANVLTCLGFKHEHSERLVAHIGLPVADYPENMLRWGQEELDSNISGLLSSGAQYKGSTGKRLDIAADGVLEALAIGSHCNPDVIMESVLHSLDQLKITESIYLEDLLHKAVLYVLGFKNNKDWAQCTLEVSHVLHRIKELIPCAEMVMKNCFDGKLELDSWVSERLPDIHNKTFMKHGFLAVEGTQVMLYREPRWS